MSQYTLQSPTLTTEGVTFWALVNPDSTIIPFEYTGWKDEVRAWQDNAYIGTAISDTIFPYDIVGPGAKEFMKKYFVNNFENVTWGKSKHGMMLNPNGNIAGDGVVLPISEEKYTTSCWPYIQYCLDREHAAGNMLDVEGIFNLESFIMYQVGGPRSLEIIERATGEDFHDLEYLCFRDSTIAGCPVRVLRLGMAGTLSYEIHIQSYEYCEPVYGALIAAGEKYEARRLGYHAYMNFFSGKSFMHADKVLNDVGEQVGISSGCGQIAHYHHMISLASVKPEYAEEGTELKVLWGGPEYPQIEIRAKVAKLPYIRLPLNADFDVSQVPHGNR